MVKKNSERIIWLDIIRILAIYLVILVHSLGASDKNTLPISSAIASTSVPLFVILSGALLLNKKEGRMLFYKKRFLRLILPWITWTLIYFIFKFIQTPHLNPIEMLSLLSSTFSSFWFLPMIAALYILTPALRIFINNAKITDIVFIICLWFISICILPYFKNSLAFPFYTDNGIVKQVFTYLGYYLLGFLLIKIKLPRIRVALFGLIFGMSLCLINFYIRINNNLFEPYFSFNFIYPGVVISAVSIFLLIRSQDKRMRIASKKLKLIIISLSSAALGIFFIHGLLTAIFLKIVQKPYLINAPILGEWINSLFLFTLSYLIILLLTKIPYVKKFIT